VIRLHPDKEKPVMKIKFISGSAMANKFGCLIKLSHDEWKIRDETKLEEEAQKASSRFFLIAIKVVVIAFMLLFIVDLYFFLRRLKAIDKNPRP
jgi:archaellum biogenesis protein FlaJ (TadC family)